MCRKASCILAIAAFLAFVMPVSADYIPLPVKWSQPIGFNAAGFIIGKDRLSDHTVNVVRADDFICNINQPIVAVRWWGSYIGEGPGSGLQPRPTTPPGVIGPFDISFHLSVGGPHPFSLPEMTPLYLTTVHAQEAFVGVDEFGDYVYRYDAYLPTPFFQQGSPTHPIEYFLDIDKPTQESWGWHESPFGGLDFPAVAPTHFGPWTHDLPHDLAFELMTIPEPTQAVFAMLGGLSLLALRRRTS